MPPEKPSCYVSQFHEAIANGDYPYDVGDDPSFFIASLLNRPVTWGVCRADVRGKVKCGDWVAFFAARTSENEPEETNYYFIGALEVECTTSQRAIWLSRTPQSDFRDYLNLLIRPCGKGWEHFEPVVAPNQWHKDWLWRLCRQRGLQKKQVVLTPHITGEDLPYSATDNYIIFSNSTQLKPAKPIIVATHHRGDDYEQWGNDKATQDLRKLIFQNLDRKNLRIRNKSQPHRHFVRDLHDAEIWAEELQMLLLSIS